MINLLSGVLLSHPRGAVQVWGRIRTRYPWGPRCPVRRQAAGRDASGIPLTTTMNLMNDAKSDNAGSNATNG